MAFADTFDDSFDMHLSSPPADSDTFICPQDVTMPLESSISQPSAASSPAASSECNDPSSPSHDDSVPTKKKRKSWGQVLPTPTTSLPPRKRAKTEAEKEQRKYERVQRNRQAAHNSRMRKQQEMDNLSKRNKDLERQNSEFRARIERLQAELRLARGQSPQPPHSPTDSMESRWSVSAPSLCEATSPSDTSSSSLDQAPTPCEVKFEADSVFDMKKFDDSHSAVDVEFPFGSEPAAVFDGGMKEAQQYSDVNIDFNNFINLDGLTDSILTQQEVAWNPTLDTDFLGDMNLDANSIDNSNNIPFQFNINDMLLTNSSLDPPMFELPACGS